VQVLYIGGFLVLRHGLCGLVSTFRKWCNQVEIFLMKLWLQYKLPISDQWPIICQAFQLHVFHTVIRGKEYRRFPKLVPKKYPQIRKKEKEKKLTPWRVFCTSKC
jgi:hypothetical protein